MTRQLPLAISRRLAVLATAAVLASPTVASAETAHETVAKGRAALAQLNASQPKTVDIGKKAKAVLVFPSILKAGAIVAGQQGQGVLLVKGKATAFYSLLAGSVGLQAGAQKYGYALYFMTDSALEYLNKNKGWAVGSGPSVALIDEGFVKNVNTTTLEKDVYAVAFNQKGLMAGIDLEGSKITQVYPKP